MNPRHTRHPRSSELSGPQGGETQTTVLTEYEQLCPGELNSNADQATETTVKATTGATEEKKQEKKKQQWIDADIFQCPKKGKCRGPAYILVS